MLAFLLSCEKKYECNFPENLKTKMKQTENIFKNRKKTGNNWNKPGRKQEIYNQQIESQRLPSHPQRQDQFQNPLFLVHLEECWKLDLYLNWENYFLNILPK